jgi:O-Antigen ligase
MTAGDAVIEPFDNLPAVATTRKRLLSPAGWTVAIFLLLIAVLLAAGGAPARYGIPVVSTAAAYVLYRQSTLTYVSFVWWLWFLTPFVRRLVDFRSGFAETSPILAVPFLACLVCAPTLLKAEIWKRRSSLPFVLASGSAAYGLLVGVLIIPKKILLTAALGWLAPLVFGFYILAECSDKEKVQAIYQTLQRTFCWGVLIMGVYGVIQFAVVPGWDALWANETEMSSIGTAEPFAMRVFSTMNGPGALAYTLVAGLLLLVKQRGWLPMIATAAGYATFLLSSVRAAWAAWLLAMLLLALRERKYLLRLAVGVAVLGVCIGAAMVIEPVQEAVLSRLQTFTDLQNDTSYQERKSGSEDMVIYAQSEPFGTGLGTMDAKFAGKTTLGTRDSGFWEIFLSLGWIGGSLYLLAFAIVAWTFLKPGVSRTSLEITAGSISVALMAQLLLGSVMIGVAGTIIWMFAAMGIASREDVKSAPPAGLIPNGQ